MYIMENSLLFKEWNVRKNEELGLDPSKLVIGTNKYAFWKCSICGNEWKAQIAKRGIRGQGCPLCGRKKSKESRVKKQIEEQGSLADNFPEIADEWDYDLNGNAKPEEYTPISHKRFNWVCKKCGRKWNISINSRCILEHGCPKCAGAKRWKTRQEKDISL